MDFFPVLGGRKRAHGLNRPRCLARPRARRLAGPYRRLSGGSVAGRANGSLVRGLSHRHRYHRGLNGQPAAPDSTTTIASGGLVAMTDVPPASSSPANGSAAQPSQHPPFPVVRLL